MPSSTSSDADREDLSRERRGPDIDYTAWDWLPRAAEEIQDYLTRLLAEGSIAVHAVEARSKSIASFQEKCLRKGYDDPPRQVTDTVAVRLIMYSATDRDRAAELVRERFTVSAEPEPAQAKPDSHRGYDSFHLVVTGERPGQEHDWLAPGGALARYFASFGGLEIQIRTVAAHAWSEFEHARRYKSAAYEAIGSQDRDEVDRLFGVAADARAALDQAFVAIEEVLAAPPSSVTGETEDDTDEDGLEDAQATSAERDEEREDVPSDVIDAPALAAFLAERFPEDTVGSAAGVAFGVDLLRASGITRLRTLEAELSAIDSAQVRRLMDTKTPVTRVRRLDDELLGLRGEEHIKDTAHVGTSSRRDNQLRWRYDRLRGKVTVRPRSVRYQLFGADCPDAVRAVQVPAPRAVREIARILADREGAASVERDGAISRDESGLLPASRPRPVRLADGTQIWVATAVGRRAAERLMVSLLDAAMDTDLVVLRDGERFLSTN